MLNLLGLLKKSVHLVESLRPTVILSQTPRVMAANQSTSVKRVQPADRLKGTEKNLWMEYTALARDYKAVNLGQGFPDFAAPDHVRQALIDCMTEPSHEQTNQYTRGFGHPRLVAALSRMFSPLHGREIDAQNEILVSQGGYQALFCVFMGLVNPGDEVIIIEPFFDCYLPMTSVAGGTCRFVSLRPNRTGCVTSASEWRLDPEELAAAFTPRTKLLVVNTPNNPLGKVFKRDELSMIAELCIKNDVVCVSDEVYEHLTFGDNEHVRIASLPGMWERTLTVSSAGKTFSVTGWKLGWTIGPKQLMKALQTMHQNSLYNLNTPCQEAVARAIEFELSRLDSPECYFKSLSVELRPKMERMAKFLQEAGLNPVIPDGGYFILAENKALRDKVNLPEDEDNVDARLIKWLTKNKKLAAIPPSFFYSKEHAHIGENYIRFCFIKKEETLDAAFKIMQEL